MDKSLVILAAGIGSRFGGFKQMEPVGPSGEFIIDYSVFDALRAGFNHLVFVIRRDLEDAFRTSIGARVEPRVRTDYVFQELSELPAPFAVPDGRTKPWGTVHAVLACADAVKSPFAAINADDFYGRESYEVLSRQLGATQPDNHDYSMVGFKLRNTLSDHGGVTRGVCRAGSDGYLRDLVEVSAIEKSGDGARVADGDQPAEPLTGDTLVSMNFWGFTPAIFGALEKLFIRFLETSVNVPKSEYVIPTAVNALISNGTASVKVLQTDSTWLGITHRDDREPVARSVAGLIEAGDYPARLWA